MQVLPPDRPFLRRVEHQEVGIAARRELALTGPEPHDLGGVGRDQLHPAPHAEAARVHAGVEQNGNSQLDGGLPRLHVVDRRSHDPEAVLEPHEGVIGGHDLEAAVLERLPANLAIGGELRRRIVVEQRAPIRIDDPPDLDLFVAPQIVLGEAQVRENRLAVERQPPGASLGERLDPGAGGHVEDVERRP